MERNKSRMFELKNRFLMKEFNGCKYCTNCECIYPVRCFVKNGTSSGFLTTKCSFCISEQKKEYYKRNKEKEGERMKENVICEKYRENKKLEINGQCNCQEIGTIKKIELEV